MGSLPSVPLHLINPYAGSEGVWVRGNLHGHCHESSACASVGLREGIRKHHDAGARFLAITDHDHVTDLSEVRRLWPDIAFLEGFEWSASENILFIGEHVPPLYEESLREALQGSSDLLTVICHPKPSRSRDYWTVPMIAALVPSPSAIEIYNAHYSRRNLVYPDPNPQYTDIWDSLLSRGMRLWGVADDDSHDPPDFGRTLTMACVKDPSPRSLLVALRAGKFYASTGLLMENVDIRGREINVRLASPAAGRFVGPGGRVLRSGEGREFTCLHAEEAYIRFEAQGPDGRIFLQPFFSGGEDAPS